MRSRFEKDDDWRRKAEALAERANRLREELQAVEEEAAQLAVEAALEDRLDAHLQDRPVAANGQHHVMRICQIAARDYGEFHDEVARLRAAHPDSIGLEEHQLPVVWATALRSEKASATGEITINLFYYVLPNQGPLSTPPAAD